MFSDAKETDSVLMPLAVISVFLSSSVFRLVRYLLKAMLLKLLSVMLLFFCLMLLFKFKVSRVTLFQLSLISSIPISLIRQSYRYKFFSFVQYFDSPQEQRDLFVILCQFMPRFKVQRLEEFQTLNRQETPQSSTEVACRSSFLMCLMLLDSARIMSPQLVISEFPKRTSSSNLVREQHLDMIARDSSVIILSAIFKSLSSGIIFIEQRISIVISVMKLKFDERSNSMTQRGTLIILKRLKESSLTFEFFKLKTLTFSIVLLQIASLISESSSNFSLSC